MKRWPKTEVSSRVSKALNDMTSNTVLLLSKNISAVKIAKYGKQAISEVKDLEDLRSEALVHKLDVMAGKKGAQKKLDEINKKIKDHPISFALYHGMIQSISTDIVLKDYDTVSGLQRDIEKLFNKITHNKDGETLTGVGSLVKTFMQKGYSAEDALQVISAKTKGSFLPDAVSEVTEEVSNNLKRIKKQEDVDKYLSQFIAGPDSEAARIGSALTQYADLIPRIIMFKDRIDNGFTEEEAVKESLESFIDYKVNMPKEIKILSDYGVLLFPSFWMRIQRIILMQAKNSPASVIGTLSMSQMMGGHLPNIIDSNIFGKWSNDQILNVVDLELLPVNILG